MFYASEKHLKEMRDGIHGGFAAQLAEAYGVADSSNGQKLLAAFPGPFRAVETMNYILVVKVPVKEIEHKEGKTLEQCGYALVEKALKTIGTAIEEYEDDR